MLELNNRARKILSAITQEYLSTGEAVGSRTVTRRYGVDLSPASVRNVMADLEELGLVSAPHTSAGRIPTSQGYRVFVDSLLQFKQLDDAQQEEIRREMPATGTTQSLLANASSLLSGITHFVGLVTVPRREQFAFRQLLLLRTDLAAWSWLTLESDLALGSRSANVDGSHDRNRDAVAAGRFGLRLNF